MAELEVNPSAKLHVPFSMWVVPSLTCDLVPWQHCLTVGPVVVLSGFLQNFSWKEACQYWWQHPFCLRSSQATGSHPKHSSPLCLSSKALRSVSSPHCHTQAFLGSCPPHAPRLLASCYKLFQILASITFSTHALKHTTCHIALNADDSRWTWQEPWPLQRLS